MKVMVTGAAGFIGAALSNRLLRRGDSVTGVDSLNTYYDVSLKRDRLQLLQESADFRFQQLDIADREGMSNLFSENNFDVVVNLAAQAGVRHSIEAPEEYIDANLVGFANILEGCRHQVIGHLVFASSSSVYGANTKLPFSESDNVDHPISLYAASKKANELMAHSYAHLYRLPCTGLRFFTVYGPWGRPDMALFRFTKGIIEGKPIPVFNHGKMVRDFTYIDDIVEGITRVIDSPASPDSDWSGDRPNPSTSMAPYRIYNIGNSKPVELMRYIEVLEKSIGKNAMIDFLPMQAGDVSATNADMTSLAEDLQYRTKIDVEEGVARFVDWYRSYYDV